MTSAWTAVVRAAEIEAALDLRLQAVTASGDFGGGWRHIREKIRERARSSWLPYLLYYERCVQRLEAGETAYDMELGEEP